MSMAMKNDGIYINGKLAWANPNPGSYINCKARHIIEKDGTSSLWVNETLVYSETVLDDPDVPSSLLVNETPVHRETVVDDPKIKMYTVAMLVLLLLIVHLFCV